MYHSVASILLVAAADRRRTFKEGIRAFDPSDPIRTPHKTRLDYSDSS